MYRKWTLRKLLTGRCRFILIDMAKKIITVGTTTQNNRMVNGQTMMFQMLVDKMRHKGFRPVIVDFGLSIKSNYGNERVSGKFSFIKLLDNFRALIHYLCVLIANPGVPVYINTSQSKVGFLRDYFFIRLAKLFRRKVIGHQFGANYQSFYTSQSKEIQKRIKETLDLTDRFIVEGEYTKKQLYFVNDYLNKVIAIPNGLPQEIDQQNVAPKRISTPVQILYLSNMIEGKGYWDVLEAANILNNQYKIDLRLVFAGQFLADTNDEYTKSAEEAKRIFLQRLIDYGLEDKTVYYPGLYGTEKSINFLKAHFFILPSYYINEGQPVSVLEALAYGCVPIVTEYRLIPTMVNRDNGFFVDPKSPDQIAEKILYSLNNSADYCQKSENGILYYKNNFTVDRYVDQILQLFNYEI